MVNPLDFFRSAKRVKDGTAETSGPDATESRLRPGERIPDSDAPASPRARLYENDAILDPAGVEVSPVGSADAQDLIDEEEIALARRGEEECPPFAVCCAQ